jgi:epoxide hydrolase 4
MSEVLCWSIPTVVLSSPPVPIELSTSRPPPARQWMATAFRTRRVVTADGVGLHLVIAGHQGRPILFLHGFPECWLAWSEQLNALGRDHRAAAMDLRGYHQSNRPASLLSYRLPLLVADVRTVLASLAGDEPAILVGHGWGGRIAWEFARAHPELLHQLVIINTPHPAIHERELAHDPAQRRASRHLTLFRRHPLAEWILRAGNCALLRRAVFRAAATPGAFSPAKQAAYLDHWRQPGALTGGLNHYRVTPTPSEAANPWKPIEVPTLVLAGERSPYLIPGHLEGLTDYVPRLRVVRFPTATHWLVHEQPARVNAELRRGV